VSPRYQAESLGHIHHIGAKNTKYMPFPYKRAPLPDKSSCWYSSDYYPKQSEYAENKQLAECFRGPTHQCDETPLLETTSHHRQNFVKHSKEQMRRSIGVNKTPPPGRTQTTGGVDMTLETQSSSHSCHRAHPRVGSSNKSIPPLSNLHVTGVDSGDCFRTTYGSDFYLRTRPRMPIRTTSAPIVGMGSLDA